MKNFSGRMHIYLKCFSKRATCSPEERKALSENILYDAGKLVVAVGVLLTGGFIMHSLLKPRKKKKKIRFASETTQISITPASIAEDKPSLPQQSKEEQTIAQQSGLAAENLLPQKYKFSLSVAKEIQTKITSENDPSFLGYEIEASIHGQEYITDSPVRYSAKDYAANYEIEIDQNNWIDMGVYYTSKDKAQAFKKSMDQFVHKLQQSNKLPLTIHINSGVKKVEN